MSIIRYNPGPSHRFFVHDPNGDGISFWQSEAERDQAAKEAIQGYLSDGEWHEDVVCVVVGVVTHKAEAVNIQHPVGEIDDEGYDEAGEYWPDPDARYCDYALVPLEEES